MLRPWCRGITAAPLRTYNASDARTSRFYPNDSTIHLPHDRFRARVSNEQRGSLQEHTRRFRLAKQTQCAMCTRLYVHVCPRPPWANGERIGGKPSNIKTGLIGNRGPSVCFNISAEFLVCNHRRVHNLPAPTTNHGLRYELITAVACTHATTEKVRDKTSYQQAQLSGGDIWWTTSKRTQHQQPLTKYTPRNQAACSAGTGPCDATTISGSKDRQPFPIQRYSKRQPTFSSLPRRSPGTPDLCQLSSQHPHHPSTSVTTTWR